jgi:mitochondrial-processing peptidase subunit beta
VEVYRARNRYWNELLQRNNPIHMSWANSIQIAYLDRMISRTEIATRISHMDPAHLSRVATKWFWDKEIAVTAWGPLHHVMSSAHYHRPYKRSTLGEYSLIGVKTAY